MDMADLFCAILWLIGGFFYIFSSSMNFLNERKAAGFAYLFCAILYFIVSGIFYCRFSIF